MLWKLSSSVPSRLDSRVLDPSSWAATFWEKRLAASARFNDQRGAQINDGQKMVVDFLRIRPGRGGSISGIYTGHAFPTFSPPW